MDVGGFKWSRYFASVGDPGRVGREREPGYPCAQTNDPTNAKTTRKTFRKIANLALGVSLGSGTYVNLVSRCWGQSKIQAWGKP